MPRRKIVAKRERHADPKYNSVQLSQFINAVMISGKKSKAEIIVYDALEISAQRLRSKPAPGGSEDESTRAEDRGAEQLSLEDFVISIFKKALGNVRPTVEVRSRRVGGATYQVPIEVRSDRSLALAMRWIIQCARKRSEKGMTLRLAGEFCDAYGHRGAAVKKREDTHRMAKANQAFAHFRWT